MLVADVAYFLLILVAKVKSHGQVQNQWEGALFTCLQRVVKVGPSLCSTACDSRINWGQWRHLFLFTVILLVPSKMCEHCSWQLNISWIWKGINLMPCLKKRERCSLLKEGPALRKTQEISLKLPISCSSNSQIPPNNSCLHLGVSFYLPWDLFPALSLIPVVVFEMKRGKHQLCEERSQKLILLDVREKQG